MDIHISTTGSGAPLVLLHGWAMHGGVFAPLLQRLQQHFTLHLVDLPGHGYSRASRVPLTLEACIDALLPQLPIAPWLGWSLGGLLALHAASRHPQRVRKLIMLCATPQFVRSDDWRYGVSAEIFADFASGLRTDYTGTLERFIALEAFGSDHARDDIRQLHNQIFAHGEPAASVLADGLQLLQHSNLRPLLATLQVPSLWLAGRRDRLVDPRAMRIAAEQTPHSQLHVFEHAGHAPFLTDADTLAGLLTHFCNEPPA